MNDSRRILRAALLTSAAAILTAAAVQLREKKQVADVIVKEIEDRIAALDPITRAAVVAELSADVADHVRDLRQ